MPRYAHTADSHEGLISDRFELVRLLGEGNFAQVYEAVDIELGRRIAIKLFDDLGADSIEPALREARAMARVNHPNVLSVHDIGQHRGTPFLAIEFAEIDLRRWLARETRSSVDILALFCEAGAGLAAAHAAGLVHRDFKPANIMVRRNGSVAVGDFGLAHHLEAGGPSHPSEAFGTLRYICPERLRGEPGDERGDQFSFCLALWEALAGRDPFCGGSTSETRYQAILAGPLGQPRGPAHVITALRRGLEPDPDQRFASMAELLAALSSPPRPRRRRLLGPSTSAAMLLGVFLVGVFFSREAPALEVDLPQDPELLSQAGLDFALDRSFDGQCMDSVKTLMHVLPAVRQTLPSFQREYLVQIEVLAAIQSEAGDYTCAATTYAAAINLAEDLSLDSTQLSAKKSEASARAREAIRALDPKR